MSATVRTKLRDLLKV